MLQIISPNIGLQVQNSPPRIFNFIYYRLPLEYLNYRLPLAAVINIAESSMGLQVASYYKSSFGLQEYLQTTRVASDYKSSFR